MGNAGNRLAWIALAIALSTAFAGCLDAGTGEASTHEACEREGWTLTEAEDADVRICHPEDWQARNEIPGLDTDLALVPAGETTQSFAANLNVLHMEVPEEMTFDEFVTANVDTLPQMVTDFQLGTSERLDREHPTHELAYTGRQGVHDLEWRQRMVYDEPTAYVVTYTEPVQREAVSQATLEDVLDSFAPT